jgi:hypothetical protein
VQQAQLAGSVDWLPQVSTSASALFKATTMFLNALIMALNNTERQNVFSWNVTCLRVSK